MLRLGSCGEFLRRLSASSAGIAKPLDPAADLELLDGQADHSDCHESGPAAEVVSEDGKETNDNKDDRARAVHSHAAGMR
jgi:hypothetical protein